MHALDDGERELLAPPANSRRRPILPPGQLPPEVASAVWRADQLGTPVTATVPSGWAALDALLTPTEN